MGPDSNTQNQMEQESGFGEQIKKTAKETAKAGAKKGLKKAGKWAAAKLGLEAALQAIPGAGQILTILLEVGIRILRGIKKLLSELTGEESTGKLIIYTLGGATVGFIMLGLNAPAFISGVAFVGAGASYVGGRSISAGISGFFESLVFGITHVVLPAIGIPLLFSIFFIPLSIAIVYFIITSGAYVVPPQSIIAASDNPYINIDKEPEPPGPFDNSDLDLTVEYTITIEATRGSLTNIQFNYDCRVIGPSVDCPDPSPDIPDPPDIISPVQPYTITYTQTYNSSFADSLVIDTFTVTADVPEQLGTTTSTSATIVIGNPPIDCPLPTYNTLGGMWASYTPGDETRGHGSNFYWNSLGLSCSSYALPQSTGCHGPSDSAATNNMCRNMSSTCDFYGYAYDVFPGSHDVLAPEVGGQPQTWNCNYAFANGGGSGGYTYRCSSGQYTLTLTHIQSPLENGNTSGTFQSGEKISELERIGNDHLHMEFQVNGVYVRPEDFFCF